MAISFHSLSFIVVDDSTHMRRILVTMLRGFGARAVYEAEDGADALEKIQMNMPDIIITDWVMPVLDGEELVKMIRTPSSPSGYAPIIMVSGYTERSRVQQASAMGVNHFLCKPVSAKALYDRIADCILRPRKFIRSPTYFGPEPREMKKVQSRRFIGVPVDEKGMPIESNDTAVMI
jgi:two-component system chemotaxis response regulator CheY